ncbi:ATP synthase mitochondrial F1 complex assembly factor 1-like, partial [Saccoglossus kowalevskii]
IVLMHGEHDTKTLKVQEAQFLANQLQMYYGSDSVTKQQLLETFTKQPDKFNHMDLIKEMELTELPLTNSL